MTHVIECFICPFFRWSISGFFGFFLFFGMSSSQLKKSFEFVHSRINLSIINLFESISNIHMFRFRNSDIPQSNTPRVFIIWDQGGPHNLISIGHNFIRNFSKGDIPFFIRKIKREIFIFNSIMIFKIINQSFITFFFSVFLIIARGKSEPGDSVPFSFFENGDINYISKVDSLIRHRNTRKENIIRSNETG